MQITRQPIHTEKEHPGVSFKLVGYKSFLKNLEISMAISILAKLETQTLLISSNEA